MHAPEMPLKQSHIPRVAESLASSKLLAPKEVKQRSPLGLKRRKFSTCLKLLRPVDISKVVRTIPKSSQKKGSTRHVRHWEPLSGRWVLYIFALTLIAFGVFALIYYWDIIHKNTDTWLFAAGLFLVMAAGMFVQVLATNYRAGRGLFEITAVELVFPLFFALVVYYPVWASAESSPRNLFSFYAAFLNGYFWKTVVSAAKRQRGAKSTLSEAAL